MKTKRLLLAAGLAVLIWNGTGCANVKPWQRGTMAEYVMRSDRDPMADGLNEHLWFSREAASGGRGVGGCGCGCN